MKTIKITISLELAYGGIAKDMKTVIDTQRILESAHNNAHNQCADNGYLAIDMQKSSIDVKIEGESNG